MIDLIRIVKALGSAAPLTSWSLLHMTFLVCSPIKSQDCNTLFLSLSICRITSRGRGVLVGDTFGHLATQGAQGGTLSWTDFWCNWIWKDPDLHQYIQVGSARNASAGDTIRQSFSSSAFAVAPSLITAEITSTALARQRKMLRACTKRVDPVLVI